MIDAFLANPYPVLGAILLASFVGYVVRRNNFKIRRAAACGAFRSAFLANLEGYYPIPSNWPDNAIAVERKFIEIFPKLQIAVEQFRPFVPWYRRHNFDVAWFSYRSAYGFDEEPQNYDHYANYDGTGPATLQKNISDLLSFADEL